MRIIAGPCQHESVEQSLEIARECKRVCGTLDIDYVFKDPYNTTVIKGDCISEAEWNEGKEDI